MAPPPSSSSLFFFFFRRCCFTTILLHVILCAATNICPVKAAEEFKVGDVLGWQQPPLNDSQLYSAWASNKRFHVGDSLRFEYDNNNDSVVVVDKWGYFHCNTTNLTSVFTDGNTVINLDTPGLLYFISGQPDHCKDGQRLALEVLPLHRHSSKIHPPQSQSPAPSPISSSTSAAVSVSFINPVHLVALLIALLCFSA